MVVMQPGTGHVSLRATLIGPNTDFWGGGEPESNGSAVCCGPMLLAQRDPDYQIHCPEKPWSRCSPNCTQAQRSILPTQCLCCTRIRGTQNLEKIAVHKAGPSLSPQQPHRQVLNQCTCWNCRLQPSTPGFSACSLSHCQTCTCPRSVLTHSLASAPCCKYPKKAMAQSSRHIISLSVHTIHSQRASPACPAAGARGSKRPEQHLQDQLLLEQTSCVRLSTDCTHQGALTSVPCCRCPRKP